MIVDERTDQATKAKDFKAINVKLSLDKEAAMHKLKMLRGITKAELVDLGLELVLRMKPDEITAMVKGRRG